MKKLYTSILVVLLSFSVGQVVAQIEEEESKKSLFYYSGKLGAASNIQLSLQLKSLVATGSYILDGSGDFFTFEGRLTFDKSGLGLRVFDEENNYIATIEAQVLSQEENFGKEIEGIWRGANGKLQRLKLTKIAEFAREGSTSPTSGLF